MRKITIKHINEVMNYPSQIDDGMVKSKLLDFKQKNNEAFEAVKKESTVIVAALEQKGVQDGFYNHMKTISVHCEHLNDDMGS